MEFREHGKSYMNEVPVFGAGAHAARRLADKGQQNGSWPWPCTPWVESNHQQPPSTLCEHAQSNDLSGGCFGLEQVTRIANCVR